MGPEGGVRNNCKSQFIRACNVLATLSVSTQ